MSFNESGWSVDGSPETNNSMEVSNSSETAVSSSEKGLYATLGVSPSADQREVKKAYRDMAKKVHPDANLDKTEKATAEFKALSGAFDAIKDSESRRKYDRELVKEAITNPEKTDMSELALLSILNGLNIDLYKEDQNFTDSELGTIKIIFEAVHKVIIQRRENNIPYDDIQEEVKAYGQMAKILGILK